MRRPTSAIVLLALGLAGCASSPPQVLVRTDGQRGIGNPALEQQLAIDKAICLGETQKAAISSPAVYGGGLFQQIDAQIERNKATNAIATGCMAQRGYAVVPADQAQAAGEAFAATAKAREKL
jgi:hypothetical protein